jgi:hypothetical protein
MSNFIFWGGITLIGLAVLLLLAVVISQQLDSRHIKKRMAEYNETVDRR